MPTTDAEIAQADQSYEDLEDRLTLPPKTYSIHQFGCVCQNRKSKDAWSNRQVLPWRTE